MVEHRLAKARVAGSNPVSRSSQLQSGSFKNTHRRVASTPPNEVRFPVQGAVPKR